MRSFAGTRLLLGRRQRCPQMIRSGPTTNRSLRPPWASPPAPGSAPRAGCGCIWRLADNEAAQVKNVGACAVLPLGDAVYGSLGQRLTEMFRMGSRLFIQLNGYLLLALLIAGAIKVVLPTSLITEWVGGKALNSVLA